MTYSKLLESIGELKLSMPLFGFSLGLTGETDTDREAAKLYAYS